MPLLSHISHMGCKLKVSSKFLLKEQVMQMIDRRDDEYQELIIEQGLSLGKLTIRLSNDAAWTVQCFNLRKISDNTAKECVASYLRSKWHADGLRFYKKHGMSDKEFYCNFYSDLL